jgi:1,4-alpha-glucan branching enzyme
LQNHDQIGNRALGERIASLTEPAALAAATTLLLLAPQPPLLFMGQEWGARQPFCFFCDFGPELADQVRSGRRREFARFAPSSFEAVRMPDPNSETTFRAAVLDWEAPHAPGGAHWRELHRRLLRLRHEQIVPWLARPAAARATLLQPQGLQVEWNFADGPQLLLIANLHRDASNCGALPRGQPLAGTPEGIADALAQGVLPAWGVAWMWIEH